MSPDAPDTGDGAAVNSRFRRSALDRYGHSSLLGSVAFRAGRDPSRLHIGFRPPGRNKYPFPFVPQLNATDCGAACLRMVLAGRGIQTSAQQIREETATGRNGISAASLLTVARRHGLDGRGVRTNLAGLRHLRPGAILFWRFSHFVVLVRATRTHLEIADPAVGYRYIGWADADTDFTGIALEFADDPVAEHVAHRKTETETESWALAARLLPRTPRWFAALAASAALLVYALSFPFLLGHLVSAERTPIGGATSQLTWVAILLSGAASFGLLQLLRSRLIVSIQSLLEERAGHVLMARLTRLPLDFFAARHPGDLAQRVRSIARLRSIVSVTTLGAVFDAALVIGYLAVIAYREFWLSLAVLLYLAGFVIVTASSWRRQRQLSSDHIDALMRSTNQLHELVGNMTTIKALGAENTAHARWMNSFADELTTGTRQRRHAGAIVAFMSTLQFAAPLSILFVGVMLAAQGGGDLAATVSLSALSVGLFGSLSNLSLAATAFVDLGPDLVRMHDILNSPTERSGAHYDRGEDHPPALRLDAVSYTYPGAPAPSIGDVSAELPRGGSLAIIGPSGSGKSTLGMLLGGLLTPTSGRILVDDIDLSTIDPAEYRRSIGYVDQNSDLMAASIIDNLRLGCPEASLEEIRAAARAAEIDDFITALPMKYETMLGAGGAGISGGQRQRIALARALVKNPTLLILDEATSAVDPETERAILRNIAERGASTILLGHRAALTAGASAILTMVNGTGTFRFCQPPQGPRLDFENPCRTTAPVHR